MKYFYLIEERQYKTPKARTFKLIRKYEANGAPFTDTVSKIKRYGSRKAIGNGIKQYTMGLDTQGTKKIVLFEIPENVFYERVAIDKTRAKRATYLGKTLGEIANQEYGYPMGGCMELPVDFRDKGSSAHFQTYVGDYNDYGYTECLFYDEEGDELGYEIPRTDLHGTWCLPNCDNGKTYRVDIFVVDD